MSCSSSPLKIKEKVKEGLPGGGGRAVTRSAWPAWPRQKVRVAGSAAVAVVAACFVAMPVALALDVAVMVTVAMAAGGAEASGTGARGRFRRGQ